MALTGCGDDKKIQECTALIEVINDGVRRIHKHTSSEPDGGSDVAELRLLGEEMESVAKQTESVELSYADLKKYASEYQQMATEMAAAARELASAYDKVDIEGMKKARGRMDKAVKREDPLVEGLNKYCRAP
jgi:hypothetical protein